MNYVWKDLCPLTCKEAHVALAKGLPVICLDPKQSTTMTIKDDITRRAKKGAIFAVRRELLEKEETHYIANYTISRKLKDDSQGYRMRDPEQVEASKQYKTQLEVGDDCKKFLSQVMRQHGLCEDGIYWATYERSRYTFGIYEGVEEYDEGEIVVKNGEVTQVPSGFWLPFDTIVYG